MKKAAKNKNLINPVLMIVLILAGAALRLVSLGIIPHGLNQDEASIGYDAFTLAAYGMDRNGYVWPVYPITWGSGGGSPLMIYLAVLTTKLFGRSILSLRSTPAVLGVLTIPLFALTVRAEEGKEGNFLFPIFAALLIAVNPWHLMMSRWALDANTLPFFLTSAILLFVFSASGKGRFKTEGCIVSAVLFALCPYAYGSATVVIPVVLVILAVYAVRTGHITVKQALLSAAAFTVVMLPLAVFFAVNLLGLDPIVTPYFSIPVFTSSRSVFASGAEELTEQIKNNIWYLIKFFTIGSEEGEILCNYIPGYAQMYRFTFPLTFGGLFFSVRNLKKKSLTDAAMLLITAVTVIFTLFIEPDINRMTLLLIPLLYFQALCLNELYKKKSAVSLVICAVICCAAVLFSKDYFGGRYRDLSHEAFMPGYTEAVRDADEKASGKRIVSTYTGLSAPFMLALYESETPPQEFLATVKWKDENAEFRVATSFSNYTFGLPDDISESYLEECVLILNASELAEHPWTEKHAVSVFGDYAVISD